MPCFYDWFAGRTTGNQVNMHRARLRLTRIACALAALHVGCARATPLMAKQGEEVKRPAASIFVRETSGRPLASWPISGGFPFAKGAVRDTDKLRLTAAGQPVPVQSRVLSHWPDGSVRWALLDWQADLKAQEIAEFRVDSGPAPAPAPTRLLRVQESEAAVEVDSGVLRFRIPKRRAALIEDIKLDGQPATTGPVTCFLSIDGKRTPCQAPTSVRVIDAGPLRARIEMRGAYADRFVYVVRVDAYAGQPFVRVFHTFEQHSPEPYTSVQQIAIEIPVAAAATYRFGVEDGKPIAGAVPDAGITLLQPDNLGFKVDGKASTGHAAGWAALQGAEHGLAIAARYFWQEYPKSIELRRDGVTYNLWAASAAPAKIGSGAAKTHELALYFSAKKEPAATLLDALRSPLLPYANPAWTVHTQALRNALAPDGDARSFLDQLDDGYRRQAAFTKRERWDDSGAAICAPAQAERPRSGFFGMFNWGDWNYPGYHDTTKGCEAWGNLEYDKTQVLALAFAATGKAPYADDMVAAARHFMDVDTIHFSAQRPQWVGMNHPKNPLHFTFELGGIDLGHTWTEGLLSYYLLSGDERALEMARGIADRLVARIRLAPMKGNPRQWGWPQIALVAMYELSGEDSYRQAALAYARGAIAAHPPDRIRDWKLGILAESLAYTDSVATDVQIRDWLSRYAAAVTAYSAAADRRFMPALAYVGRVGNKPEYTQAALKSVQGLVFGNWSKPFTIAGRVGFSVLGGGGGDHRTDRTAPTDRSERSNQP